jgi:hypothetical protein
MLPRFLLRLRLRPGAPPLVALATHAIPEPTVPLPDDPASPRSGYDHRQPDAHGFNHYIERDDTGQRFIVH